MNVSTTKDYSIFKIHPSNRPIDENNLKKIVDSIRSKNLLQFRPIVVNTKMEIIDGQHRLAAAKILDIEVYYTISRDSDANDIILLNVNQKKWAIDDYVHYYISIGNENYIKFSKFKQNEKIDSRQTLRLMGKSGSSSLKVFREGKFQFPEDEKVDFLKIKISEYDDIIDTIKTTKIGGNLICARAGFKEALLEMIKSQEFETELFKHKLSFNIDKIRICSTREGYLGMLRDIYNWKNRNKAV